MKKLITTALAALAFSAAAQPIPAGVPLHHIPLIKQLQQVHGLVLTFHSTSWGATSMVAGGDRYALKLVPRTDPKVVMATSGWFHHTSKLAPEDKMITSFTGVSEADCRIGYGNAAFAFAKAPGISDKILQVPWTSTDRFYTNICDGAFAAGLFTR